MISKFIFPLSMLCILAKMTSASNDAESNAAEFREMCDFIKILRRKPESPSLSLEGKPVQVLDEALEALKTIGILNASTTDEQTYRSLEAGDDFEKVKENPVIKELGSDKWGTLLTLWKAEKDSPTGKLPVRPDQPGLARVHEKIGTILNEAQQAYEKIVKSEDQIRKNLLAARRDMLTAAFGEAGMRKGQGTQASEKELSHAELDQADAVGASFDDSVSNGLYEKQCNGGKSGKVGENIAADMTCLCAGKGTSGGSEEDMCAKSLNTQLSAFDKTSDAVTLWEKLREKYLSKSQDTDTTSKPTPATLRAIVLRHRALLGKGAHFVGGSSQGSYGAKSGFILGRHGIQATGPPKCDGTLVSAAQKGICVNYATVLENGKEIPWVIKIGEAAKKLEANEKLTTLQISFLSQIEGLKNKAEIYYDTALAGQGASGTVIVTSKNNDTNGKAPVAANERDVLTTGSVTNYETAFTASVVLILLYY